MELTKKAANQLPPTTKKAERTGYWHGYAGKAGGKRLNSFHPGICRLDMSVLGEMVEDAHRGYYGPIFMDLTSNWFTGIPMP